MYHTHGSVGCGGSCSTLMESLSSEMTAQARDVSSSAPSIRLERSEDLSLSPPLPSFQSSCPW